MALTNTEKSERYRRRHGVPEREKRDVPLSGAERSERHRQKHGEDVKRYSKNRILKHKYGIGIDDFERMYIEQNGCCAICKEKIPDNKMHVDHDHKTGKVRSLLCGSCNGGLGLFRDSPSFLENAVLYLKNFGSGGK